MDAKEWELVSMLLRALKPFAAIGDTLRMAPKATDRPPRMSQADVLQAKTVYDYARSFLDDATASPTGERLHFHISPDGD